MQPNAARSGDNEAVTNDLGPLAWVLDELRKSLDGATKALRRFVRDAELARGSDLAALDASQLRIARQQLHQAVGALEMVGMAEPAKVLRVMESLAQRFVQRPEYCSDDAANKVERASFALTEYLEGVLKGKDASPVALFPQYRDVLDLVGDARAHPADLWPFEWRWIDVTLPETATPLAYDSSVRARIDSLVLKVVKSSEPKAARAMRDISLGFAAGQTELQARVFWKICAAYFEAVQSGLCPADVYGKRAASRVLLQYRTLARGEPSIAERLVQDLLFFCAQAVPEDPAQAPVLAAVRAAYGLTRTKSFDYDTPQFGRFDPALLVQARKRIASATETWSALAGGDTNRLKVATDQFAQVTDSMLKLHPESSELAAELTRAIEKTARSGEAPTPSVAMEVATAVLFLEAAYDDMDPTDSHMAERSASLAKRLALVNEGGQPEPLEGWMEDLYRRVSDRQTMGSVVDELRTTLSEVEKALDTFFRSPLDKLPLHEVPSRLAQMRGVFSVLGLDQAALAALRMRSSVEKFLVDEVESGAVRSGVFEKLGNSLGAMGFLIDMLSYQRELAKKLFVYDEELGEFMPLMGREKALASAQVAASAPAPLQSALPSAELPRFPVPSAVTETPPGFVDSQADDEAELKDIFLDEAREVVHNGLAAIEELVQDPSDLAHQTTLRRSFHTLKGSSRMVGLNEFGEAAWAMEQMLNSWLATQKPASEALIKLSRQGLQGLGRWVEDIATGQDAAWSAQPFRKSADGFRLDHQEIALELPAAQPLLPMVAEAALPELPQLSEPTPQTEPASEKLPELPELPDFVTTQIADFGDTQSFQPPEWSSAERAPQPAEEQPLIDLPDFDVSGDAEFAHVSTLHAAPADETLKLLPEVKAEHDAMHGLEVDETLKLTPQAHPGTQTTQSFDADQTLKLLPEAKAEVQAEPLDASMALNLSDDAEATHRDFAEADTEFDGLAELIASPQPPVAEPAELLPIATEHLIEEQTAAQPEPVEAVAPLVELDQEDQVKVIGDLRIDIPLYNVYLNEADEWSRRLLTELNEWALELPQPLSDSTTGLAHSLAGSSATVGFKALSEISRALEHALLHVQLHAQSNPEHAKVFIAAAEDIRRLLHQFAAGFLKTSDQTVLEALRQILATDFPVAVAEVEQPEISLPEFADELGEASTELAPMAELQPLVDADLESEAVAAPVQEQHLTDVLDVDLFPIFEEEGLELLPQLGGALRQWTARPDNAGARTEVLRVLHTLKGSARLAGARQLGEMSHRMESDIEGMGTESLQSTQIEPLLTDFDAIQQNFDQLRATPEQALSLPENAPVPEAPMVSASAEEAVPATPIPAPAPMLPTAMPRASSNQTVRVRSQLLDRLVNQAGEVMITRSRLDVRLGQLRGSLSELTGNLDRLRTQLRDIEVQSESQMQSRLAQAKDSAQGFDPLEFDRFTRVQELTRMMAESVHDVATVQRSLQSSVEGTEDDLIAQARQARELQRDLLRTRMVEFDSISDRLHGVVRQSAKDTGKLARLEIVGGSLDMDRGVLERMAPVFEHVLRNAVAHGVESPELRTQSGKATTGLITIELQQQSNDVTVEFGDDGAGLDLERIRQKAMSSGLFPSAQSMTDTELANLIFAAGFSTATQVTELAGRGIGLDVVRSEVNALGGRIETSTARGQGSKFKLVLPLTTAVTQVVMLRMGELMIGVPANLVELIRRVPATEVERAYQSGVYEHGGEQVAFFWAGALLQASVQSSERKTKNLAVAIFRSAGQRVAMHVDEVLGNQEVVVKNLGPQLARLPALTGMSVLASGAVVLIYNPVALATVYGAQARQLVANAAESASAAVATSGDVQQPKVAPRVNQLPLVLVVDDSITVRRVTQRLLKREGFRVALAADGLQALERLQEEKPSVVLSDIEMPRMDGFDLARNIRGDAKLRDLPIIMITSRIAEKHREHAQELGVDHYLGKPYSEDELIGLVRQYCAEAVEL